MLESYLNASQTVWRDMITANWGAILLPSVPEGNSTCLAAL